MQTTENLLLRLHQLLQTIKIQILDFKAQSVPKVKEAKEAKKATREIKAKRAKKENVARKVNKVLQEKKLFAKQ